MRKTNADIEKLEFSSMKWKRITSDQEYVS